MTLEFFLSPWKHVFSARIAAADVLFALLLAVSGAYSRPSTVTLALVHPSIQPLAR